MTTMGKRFGIQGLGAEAVHSIRDVNNARISEVSRPTEETKEVVHPEFAASYSGASNEGQETRSIFCCPEDVRKSEFGALYIKPTEYKGLCQDQGLAE